MDIKIMEEKNIAEELNGSNTKVILIPGQGVTIQNKDGNCLFKLGNDIREYKFYDYEYVSKTIEDNGNCYDADSYNFIDIPITAWTDTETGDKYIDLIKCDVTCIWQGKDLIGMLYEVFINNFNVVPDLIDKQWSPGPFKKDRNYSIYTFNSLGISLWVWRNRIRQILISMPDIDND